MPDSLVVTKIAFTPAPAELRMSGLLGFIRLDLNRAMVVDGLAVRRSRQGTLVLTWPERRGTGGRHRLVRPLHAHDRESLDRAILDELQRRGDIS